MSEEGAPFDVNKLPPADKIVGTYIALRDKVKEIKKKHAEELAPYARGMEALEGAAAILMRHLKTTLSTENGSAFWVPQETVKCDDFNAFIAFVSTTGNWSMLTRHVAKDAVLEWATSINPDTKKPNGMPPGLIYDYDNVVQFRKG